MSNLMGKRGVHPWYAAAVPYCTRISIAGEEISAPPPWQLVARKRNACSAKRRLCIGSGNAISMFPFESLAIGNVRIGNSGSKYAT